MISYRLILMVLFLAFVPLVSAGEIHFINSNIIDTNTGSADLSFYFCSNYTIENSLYCDDDKTYILN